MSHLRSKVLYSRGKGSPEVRSSQIRTKAPLRLDIARHESLELPSPIAFAYGKTPATRDSDKKEE